MSRSVELTGGRVFHRHLMYVGVVSGAAISQACARAVESQMDSAADVVRADRSSEGEAGVDPADAADVSAAMNAGSDAVATMVDAESCERAQAISYTVRRRIRFDQPELGAQTLRRFNEYQSFNAVFDVMDPAGRTERRLSCVITHPASGVDPRYQTAGLITIARNGVPFGPGTFAPMAMNYSAISLDHSWPRWEAGDTLSASFTGGELPAFAATIEFPELARLTSVPSVVDSGAGVLSTAQGITVRWAPIGCDSLVYVAFTTASAPYVSEFCTFAGDVGTATISRDQIPPEILADGYTWIGSINHRVVDVNGLQVDVFANRETWSAYLRD